MQKNRHIFSAFAQKIHIDFDNHAKIHMNDAHAILDIASRKGTSSMSVSQANHMLSTLRKTYSNMVCAEAADVNQNKTINQMDASFVWTYDSNESAGNGNENTLIGSKFYKIIHGVIVYNMIWIRWHNCA